MLSRDDSRTWRAAPGAQRLICKEFSDAVVVFDTLSGRTLMLSELSWFLLNEVMASSTPCTTASLAQAAAVSAGMEGDETITPLVDTALSDLFEAGLVHAESAE